MKRILVWLITFMFLGSGVAYAEVNYTSSAHGNSSSGVNRYNATGDANFNPDAGGYAKGNCAHCHEQHASIDGTQPDPKETTPVPSKFCLFADNSENFCFYCHTSSVITNENYSATFGGASATVSGIMQAFDSTSYHNLNDVLNFADGESGWPFTPDSNPCSACHNVHIAKRNKANQGNPAYAAISKPSVHDSLWGDDTNPNERMTVYGTGATPPHYQPPYDADNTNLEPDGAASSTRAAQALKTPDYNTFCLDCHENKVPSSKTSLNPNTTSGYLTAINWNNEKHGTLDADEYITVDAPYTPGTDSRGYVLSCLDCHEPHGSPNVFLIRNSVNGGTLTGNITSRYTTAWRYLCDRCHMDNRETIHHYDTSGNDRCYIRQSGACNNCHSPAFASDTSVVMSDGTYKPIGEIKPVDKVLSFDFDKNTTCKSEVVDVSSHFVSEILEVNGVRTTPDQLFIVGRGRWVQAGELKTGDTLLGLEMGGLEKIELETPVRSIHPAKVEVVEIIVKEPRKFFVIGKGKKLLVHNPVGISCTNCHFHGSFVNDTQNPSDETIDYDPTTRVTF